MFRSFVAVTIPKDATETLNDVFSALSTLTPQFLSYFSCDSASCMFLKTQDDCECSRIETAMQELFQTDEVHVHGVEPNSVSSTALFACRIPEEMKPLDVTRNVLKCLDSGASFYSTPGVIFITASNVAGARRIATFLKAVPFENNEIFVTDDSLQIPIVRVSRVLSILDSYDIQDMFENFVPVDSVDVVEGRGEPTANVTLRCIEDCDRAIEQLNYADVEGITMVLTRFMAKGLIDKLSEYEVRVSGVDPEMSIADFRKEYSKYGKIFWCRVVPDKQDEKCNCGYIVYMDIDSAYACVNDPDAGAVFAKNTQISVFHLDFETTVQDVADIFKDELLQEPPLRIEMMNTLTHGDFHAAQLTFRTPEAAKAAVSFGNQQFSGKMRLFCKVSSDKSVFQMGSATVRVSGLSEKITRRQLVDLFGPYGMMENIVIRGDYVFVSFCDASSCDKTIEDEEYLRQLVEKMYQDKIKLSKYISKHDVIAKKIGVRWIPKEWRDKEESDSEDEFFIDAPVVDDDDEASLYERDQQGEDDDDEREQPPPRARGRGAPRGRGGQSRGGQSRGGQNRGGQNRGGQNRGGQSRGGQSRGGQDRGGYNRGRGRRP